MEKKEKGKRIDAIDALRGLAVVLMVIHHFLYDCVAFLGAPESWFSNPVFDVLHYLFAGTFIFLCGVSSRFSRSNLKRGLKTAACALAVTAVTVLLDMDILFGVLHLLAFCMLFYAAAHRWIEKLPDRFAPILYLVLLVVSAVVLNLVNPVSVSWLYPLGAYSRHFFSADYFPIFPWVFVFLLGTWAGKFIRDRRLPEKFYTFTMPVLPAIGRHALIVYLAHQPILYGIVMALQAIID